QPADQPYAFVAETIDRSGMGVATLAPRAGMRAQAPSLRERPTLDMKDMGMGHPSEHDAGTQATGAGVHGGGSAEGAIDHSTMDHSAMDHSAMGHGPAADGDPPMDHANMDMRDKSKVSFPVGVGVDMIAPMPVERVGDRGIGLD